MIGPVPITRPWTLVCSWARICRGLPPNDRVTRPKLSSGKVWHSDFWCIHRHAFLAGFLSTGIFAFTLVQDEFLYAPLFLNTSPQARG